MGRANGRFVDVHIDETVEVRIDPKDLDSDWLIEILEERGFVIIDEDAVVDNDLREVAEKVYWQARDAGNASPELRELVYRITGKIL